MRSAYLPHLDGLRAIAVSLVVIYHAGFGLVPGGFIGVDVFFVLSGFLITGQLAKALDAGEFSFKQFYLRRLRRLAPAYLVVAAASMVAAVFVLLPQDLIYHAKLTLMALLSVSNFYLANTTGGYFAAATEEIPLLHTWSLAVEEQYYLLWPVMLLLLFRVRGDAWRLPALVGLFALSLGFSIWYTPVDHERAYYLLPTRFHELLLGGLLAIYGHALPRFKAHGSELISVLGLALILGPSLVLTAESPFPSWRALLPCLGTALLVQYGQTARFTSALLTWRPMVGIGLISYSLYLWHWPIFAYVRYATGELSTLMGALGVVLAVVASALTWRFVEQPFRFRWRFSPRRSAVLLYLGPAAVLGAVLAVFQAGDGFIGRFGEDARQAVEAMESVPGRYVLDCKPGGSDRCGDVLLAGDSHAEHFGDFMNVLANDAGMTLHVRKRPGCPPLIDVAPTYIRANVLESDEKCPAFTRATYAEAHRFRYVVLAGFWSNPVIKDDRYFYGDDVSMALTGDNTRRAITRGFRRTVAAILDAGAIPVIIKDNPTTPKGFYNCPRRRLLPFYKEPCEFPLAEHEARQAFVNGVIDELAREITALVVLDPSALICTDGRCQLELSGVPIYRDDDHLNRHGSELLGRLYIEQLGNPLRK